MSNSKPVSPLLGKKRLEALRERLIAKISARHDYLTASLMQDGAAYGMEKAPKEYQRAVLADLVNSPGALTTLAETDMDQAEEALRAAEKLGVLEPLPQEL